MQTKLSDNILVSGLVSQARICDVNGNVITRGRYCKPFPLYLVYIKAIYKSCLAQLKVGIMGTDPVIPHAGPFHEDLAHLR